MPYHILKLKKWYQLQYCKPKYSQLRFVLDCKFDSTILQRSPVVIDLSFFAKTYMTTEMANTVICKFFKQCIRLVTNVQILQKKLNVTN